MSSNFKLTPKASQALTNLRASHDFGHLLEWLAEYEAKETQVCVKQDGPDLHRAQGGVEVLQRIKSAYAEAPNTLAKIQTQR